jgi:thiol-disulfide isomerase/thioredoxin
VDRKVILILSFVIAVTGLLMAVQAISHRSSSVANLNAVLEPPPQQASPKGNAEQPPQDPAEPAKGSLAPDFTLKSLPDGKQVRLSSLRGKAVVVNFWATWCEPCKVEMPSLVDLQKKYGPQGLQIVGVAMDDAEDKEITGFAHKMGVNYIVLKGTEKVGDLYGGIDKLPLTYYLDRSGKVVEQTVGLAGESVIEDAIKRSLAQSN